MKTNRWTAMAMTIAALLGAPIVTLAQQPQQGQQQAQQQQTQPGQAGQREGQAQNARPGQGQHQAMDHLIASVVAISNEEEVELAKLAASQAQHEQVKEFAREMQQQHSELNQRLSQITGTQISLNATGAGDAGTVVRGQSPDNNRRDQPSTTQQNQATTRDQAASGQASTQGRSGEIPVHQLVQVKRDIAQRCLQHAKQEMQKLSGAEFDKAFMGQQAVMHAQALAALQVYQQHASPELAQTLAQAEQVTQRHLEQAKQLCEKLADNKSTQGDRTSTNRNP